MLEDDDVHTRLLTSVPRLGRWLFRRPGNAPAPAQQLPASARRRCGSDPSADGHHATPTPAPPPRPPSDADSHADATTGPQDSTPPHHAHNDATRDAPSAATPRSGEQQYRPQPHPGPPAPPDNAARTPATPATCRRLRSPPTTTKEPTPTSRNQPGCKAPTGTVVAHLPAGARRGGRGAGPLTSRPARSRRRRAPGRCPRGWRNADPSSRHASRRLGSEVSRQGRRPCMRRRRSPRRRVERHPIRGRRGRLRPGGRRRGLAARHVMRAAAHGFRGLDDEVERGGFRVGRQGAGGGRHAPKKLGNPPKSSRNWDGEIAGG